VPDVGQNCLTSTGYWMGKKGKKHRLLSFKPRVSRFKRVIWFGLSSGWVKFESLKFCSGSGQVRFRLSSGWSNLISVRFRFGLNLVWINFGWIKFGSCSVSDQLKFGSGELRVKLTRIGSGTGLVKFGFGYGFGSILGRVEIKLSKILNILLWTNL